MRLNKRINNSFFEKKDEKAEFYIYSHPHIIFL
jgi:hypothetical protein